MSLANQCYQLTILRLITTQDTEVIHVPTQSQGSHGSFKNHLSGCNHFAVHSCCLHGVGLAADSARQRLHVHLHSVYVVSGCGCVS